MRCVQCHALISYADYRTGYCVISDSTYHEVRDDPQAFDKAQETPMDDSEESRRSVDYPRPWTDS